MVAPYSHLPSRKSTLEVCTQYPYMLAIDAVGVTKVYRSASQPAIKDISLRVEAGKIFTLLGRNGAGKTTFVRMCATQLLPTSGTISVLGYDAVRQAKHVRDLISIVPQEGRPFGHSPLGIMSITGSR